MKKFVFERYEYKYIISLELYDKITQLFTGKLKKDEYGVYTIQSLYYDTDTHLLIRTSLEKPDYKEKIRLRSYGLNTNNQDVYLELKKKYEGIVFKRRIVLKEKEAMNFFINNIDLQCGQVENEIKYFKKFYKNLKPNMLLLYDREAYHDPSSDLRVTFDRNIRYRTTDLNLYTSLEGTRLVDENVVLMEIKCTGGIPMYIVRFLSENNIYKTSFSKYGLAYQQTYFKGGKHG